MKALADDLLELEEEVAAGGLALTEDDAQAVVSDKVEDQWRAIEAQSKKWMSQPVPEADKSRRQAIVDRHKGDAGGGEIEQSIAEMEAELELQWRNSQREAIKNAPPVLVDAAKEMLSNLNNRPKVLEIMRSLGPEGRNQALSLVPGVAQELGDDRSEVMVGDGGYLSRLGTSVLKGVSGISQPIMELTGLGGTDQEIEYIRQLEAYANQEFAPGRADDPWYDRWSVQAGEMAPFSVLTAGTGTAGGLAAKAGGQLLARAASAGVPGAKAAFKAIGAVGKAPKLIGLNPATTKGVMSTGGTVAGVAATGYAMNYAQEKDQLREMGMEDGIAMKLLAGSTALVSSSLEAIMPNPFKGVLSAGSVSIKEGALKAARQYLWEAAKKAPAEISEEYAQGLASGLGKVVANWIDENTDDKTLGDAFRTSFEQGNASIGPMLFLLGAPAAAGSVTAGVKAGMAGPPSSPPPGGPPVITGDPQRDAVIAEKMASLEKPPGSHKWANIVFGDRSRYKESPSPEEIKKQYLVAKKFRGGMQPPPPVPPFPNSPPTTPVQPLIPGGSPVQQPTPGQGLIPLEGDTPAQGGGSIADDLLGMEEEIAKMTEERKRLLDEVPLPGVNVDVSQIPEEKGLKDEKQPQSEEVVQVKGDSGQAQSAEAETETEDGQQVQVKPQSQKTKFDDYVESAWKSAGQKGSVTDKYRESQKQFVSSAADYGIKQGRVVAFDKGDGSTELQFSAISEELQRRGYESGPIRKSRSDGVDNIEFAVTKKPETTPVPGVIGRDEIKEAIGGIGGGIVDGMYRKVWNDAQSGALEKMEKPPLFEQLVIKGRKRGVVRSFDDVKLISEGLTGDFESDKKIGIDNLNRLVEKYKDQSLPEQSDNADWEIVIGNGGKLFRQNPNAKTKHEKINTRSPVDESEPIVATVDQFGNPIPGDILAARREFVERAGSGEMFDIKGFETSGPYIAQKDGKLLDTLSKREMGSVQSRGNTLKPGDITWRGKPQSSDMMSQIEPAATGLAQTGQSSVSEDITAAVNSAFDDRFGDKPSKSEKPVKPPKKSSARKENSKTLSEKAADRKERTSAVKAEKLAKLKDLLKQKKITMGVDPELVAATVELTEAAIDDGVSTFLEYVTWIADNIGETATRKIAPYIEAGWARLGTYGRFKGKIDKAGKVADVLPAPKVETPREVRPLKKDEVRPRAEGQTWDEIGTGETSESIKSQVPGLEVDPLEIRGTHDLVEKIVFDVKEINSRRLAARKRRQKMERDNAPMFADQIQAEQADPYEELKAIDEKNNQNREFYDEATRQRWMDNLKALAKLPADEQRKFVTFWNTASYPSSWANFSGSLRRWNDGKINAERIVDRSDITDPDIRARVEKLDKTWATLKDIERRAGDPQIARTRLSEEEAKYAELGLAPPTYESKEKTFAELQAEKEAAKKAQEDEVKKQILPGLIDDKDELSETLAAIKSAPMLKDAKLEIDEKAGTVKAIRADGLATTIHLNANEELAVMAEKNGRDPKTVYGAYIFKRGKKVEFVEGDIYLRSDASHRTVNHELMHWLTDMGVVTKDEVDQYGGREEIARKYGNWVQSKNRPNNTVFQKIYDFLEPIFSAQGKFFKEVGERQAEKKEATADDADKLLKQAGLKVEQLADGSWQITGNTYEHSKEIGDVKREVPELGGWFNAKTSRSPANWTFKRDPRRAIADRLAGKGIGEEPKDDAVSSEQMAREEYRRKELNKPDIQRTSGEYVASVDQSTKDLVSRGLKYGMTQEVVDNQIEDIGRVVDAAENNRKMFLIGSAPGTGKTFVLGGVIRELRNRGFDRFVYVTQNENLISQVQGNLADYGLDGVEFITYTKARSKPVSTSGAVLLLDEAHSAKNIELATGRSVAQMVREARFTVYATATPFENVSEADYIAPSGIFRGLHVEFERPSNRPGGKPFPNELNGFDAWAWMFGANVFFVTNTDRSGRTFVTPVVWWDKHQTSEQDQIAANEWLKRRGVYIQRPMSLPPGTVNEELQGIDADPYWADISNQVVKIYEDAEGEAESNKERGQITAHKKNILKRLLELSKVDAAIAKAKELIGEGKKDDPQVIIFVNTKVETDLGTFALSKPYRDFNGIKGKDAKKRYKPAEIDRMMNGGRGEDGRIVVGWYEAKAAAKRMGEDIGPPPFVPFIHKIAMAMDRAEMLEKFDSVIDKIMAEFPGMAVEFSGRTPSQNASNLAKWKNNEAKLIVATMDKGGTGLSFHDTTGDMPSRYQVNMNLPWSGTKVEQVSGRLARYGTAKPVNLVWLFAKNIPFDRELSKTVGSRMRSMAAGVQGTMSGKAKQIREFDFEEIQPESPQNEMHYPDGSAYRDWMNRKSRIGDQPTSWLSGHSSGKVREAAKNNPGLGLVITPSNVSYVGHGGDYSHIMVDNGAFSEFTGSAPFSEEKFFALLDKVVAAGLKDKVQFVVVPDKVGDWQGTNERWKEFNERVRAYGMPLAYVGQDGIEEHTDKIPWDDFDVFFIGGSTPWKLGYDPQGKYKDFNRPTDQELIKAGYLKAQGNLIKEARQRGKRVHMGRVNSWKRMELANYGVQVDSADGNFIGAAPDSNLPVVLSWLEGTGGDTFKVDLVQQIQDSFPVSKEVAIVADILAEATSPPGEVVIAPRGTAIPGDSLTQISKASAKMRAEGKSYSSESIFFKMWDKFLRAVGGKRLSLKSTTKAVEEAVEDIASWIEDNPQYLDYYAKDMQAERDSLVEIHPELADDENWALFKVISGIASNNAPLEGNVNEQINAYSSYAKDGRIDATAERSETGRGEWRVGNAGFTLYGGAQGVKALHYQTLNKIIEQQGGAEGAVVWLMGRVKATQSGIESARNSVGLGAMNGSSRSAIKTTVEAATGQKEEVPRAFAIFGPKVGAYILNHLGQSEYTTVDVWESRFWRSFFKGVPPSTGLEEDTETRAAFIRAANAFAEMLGLSPSAAQAARWFYVIQKMNEAGYVYAREKDRVSVYTAREVAKRKDTSGSVTGGKRKATKLRAGRRSSTLRSLLGETIFGQVARDDIRQEKEDAKQHISDEIPSTYRELNKSEIPKKTQKAYKLMKRYKGRPGLLFPLFVKAKEGAFKKGKWYAAERKQPRTGSKIFASRPGIHAVDLPIFAQGKPSANGQNRVWVEVELPAQSDLTQAESDQSPVLPNGTRSGITSRLIGTKESYNYKTNPNAAGANVWPIAGSMKIIRVLSDADINEILTQAGKEEWISQSLSGESSESASEWNTLYQNTIDADEIPVAILDKMSRRLKSMGYDSRGAEDVRNAIKRGSLLDHHPDYIAAYQFATGSEQARQGKSVVKKNLKHINWKRLREMGTTSDPNEAGYIKPNGVFADFSGKKEGGEPGVREYDHREAGSTAGMQEVISYGWIRMDENSGSLDIAKLPTNAQFSVIRNMAERHNGELVVDLEDGLGEWDDRDEYYRNAPRRWSMEYPKGTSPRRIVNDIKKFFGGDTPNTLFQMDAMALPGDVDIASKGTPIPGQETLFQPDGSDKHGISEESYQKFARDRYGRSLREKVDYVLNGDSLDHYSKAHRVFNDIVEMLNEGKYSGASWGESIPSYYIDKLVENGVDAIYSGPIPPKADKAIAESVRPLLVALSARKDKYEQALKKIGQNKTIDDFSQEELDHAVSYGNMITVVEDVEDVPRVYFRKGNLPEGNRSWNTMEGRLEKGVSVYVTPQVGSMAGLIDRPWYYGPGVVVGYGGDDEPLIRPTGKWKQYKPKKRKPKESENTLFQKAYHGSPYKFSQFTLDHIGKGEGASSYGWGLYFAEARDVADYYRSMLAKPFISKWTIGAIPMIRLDKDGNSVYYDYDPRTNSDQDVANSQIIENLYIKENEIESAFAEGGIKAAMAAAKRIVKQQRDDFKEEWPEGVRYANQFIRTIDSKFDMEIESPGAIYQVTLTPNQDEYLIWDKPMKEQSDKVKSVLRSIKPEELGLRFSQRNSSGEGVYLTPRKTQFGRQVDGPVDSIWDLVEDSTGMTFYYNLAAQRGVAESAAEEWASRFLAKRGIRGMKYLDQFSRNENAKVSYNYVIYDASDIVIDDALFQKQRTQEGTIQAWTHFVNASKAIIGATDKADVSSFFHEWAHPLRRFLFNRNVPQSKRGNITDEDIIKIEKFVGVKYDQDGNPIWDREAEERFVDALMTYWIEGKAPRSELETVFKKISRWLSSVASVIARKVELNDEVRAIFDKIHMRGGVDPVKLRALDEISAAEGASDAESDPESLGSESDFGDLFAEIFEESKAEELSNDREIEEQQADSGPEESDERPAEDKESARRIKGRSTKVGKRKAHYEAVEISYLIASHTPFGLRVNEDFPEEWQKHQRRYENLNQGQKLEIVMPDGKFDPDIVLDPTKGHERGPTMAVEHEGRLYVVGGTRRFMMLANLYDRSGDKGQSYHDALVSEAAEFGIDANAVNEMDRPVLIRVIDEPGDIPSLIDQLNVNVQFAKDSATESASLGRGVGRNTLRVLREMGDEETLSAFLSRKGVDVVTAMAKDNPELLVNMPGWVKGDLLTKEAKLAVQNAIMGAVIPDATVLSHASPKILQSVNGALSEIVALNQKGGEWELSSRIEEAITYDAEFRRTGNPATASRIEAWMNSTQQSFLPDFVKDETSDGYRLWRYLLLHGGSRKFRKALQSTMVLEAKLDIFDGGLFAEAEESVSGNEAFELLLGSGAKGSIDQDTLLQSQVDANRQAMQLAKDAIENGVVSYEDYVNYAEQAIGDKAKAISTAMRNAWGFLRTRPGFEYLKPPQPVVEPQSSTQKVKVKPDRSSDMMSQDDFTSVKKEVVNELRERRSLPPVADVAMQTQREWLDIAERELAIDPMAGDRLVKSLNENARIVNSIEVAMLQMQYRSLNNSFRAVSDRLADATNRGDTTLKIQLQREANKVLDALDELENASKAALREWGRAGVAAQIMLAQDFSLGSILRKARVRNHGDALSEKQQAEMTAMAKMIADLEGKLAKLEQERIDRHRDSIVDESIEKTKKKVGKAGQKSKAASAIEAFKNKFSSIFSKGTDTLYQTEEERMIEEARLVVAAYSDPEIGVSTLREFLAIVQSDLGDELPAKAKAALSAAWGDARRKGEVTAPDIDTENTGAVRRLARQLQREFVQAGIKDREKVVDAVHEALQEIMPDMTRREAMDAMSNYGQFTPLSKDEISVIVRGINGELQQLAKLEDMQAGLPPLVTGMERRTPTEDERQLIKKVNELKKKTGFALKSAKRAVANQIRDLERAIKEKSRIVSGQTKLNPDEELLNLRKRRDKIREEYQKMFPRPGATREQRIAATLRALQRSIDDIKTQLATGNVDPKAPNPRLTSPELEAKRAELEALQAQRDAIRALKNPKLTPEQRAQKAYKSNLLRRIAEYQKQIAESDFEVKPKREARILTDEEVKLKKKLQDIKNEVLRKQADYWVSKLSPLQKAWYYTKETVHLSRAIKTSIDASGVLRQGGIAVFSRPGIARGPFAEMWSAAISSDREFKIAEEYRKDPMYDFAVASKLGITEDEAGITRQEEAFMGRWAKHGIGQEGSSANKFSKALLFPVSASARSYTTFLNGLRFKYFKLLVDSLGKGGQVTLEEGRQIAKFVNVATGRSDLGPLMKWVEQLNVLFFAPRYVASRFQYLTMPVQVAASTKVSWRVKQAILAEYFRYFRGLGLLLGGTVVLGRLLSDDDDEWPSVGYDPRSSDFLKIKLGETRVDPASGLSQVIVFLAKVGRGQTVLEDGTVVDMRGEKKKFFSKEVVDVMTNFVRSKLAPVPGAIVDIPNERNVVGDKVTPFTAVRDLFIPLSLADVGENMLARGMASGSVVTMLSFFGMAGSTYGPKTDYMMGTDEERNDQFEDDLKTIRWNSPDPSYSEFLTREEYGRVVQTRESRKQLLVANALHDPVRRTYKDEESYQKAIQDRDKAFEEMKKAGWGKEEIRAMLMNHWKTQYGSPFEETKEGYVLRSSVINRLRRLNKMFPM